MNQSGKVSKKILIGVSSIFGVLLLGMILIPLFINVDDYRPKIESVANENLNGKLEFGKLSLSLWGQIRINVDGLKLTDSRQQKVVAVKDVYFHLPFFSIFSGSPVLTFKMDRPELVVVKNKAGKLNVLSLMKESPKTSAGQATKPQAASESKAEAKGNAELPALVRNARLGIEMKKAHLTYKDEATDLVSEVKDLNVLAKDISLSKNMEVVVSADLDTKMGKTIQLKGPAKMSLNMAPKFKGSEFESSDITMRADMDGIEITMPGTFEKKSGLAMNASASLHATADSVALKESVVRFHNAEVKTTGEIKGFSSTPTYDFKIASNEIDLKAWNALLPKLNMKAAATLVATARVVTDAVENFSLTMKAPGNDLKASGKVVSFTKPKIDASITSSGMDLDTLIETPAVQENKVAAKVEGAPKGKTEKTASTSAGGTAAEEDFDVLLEPMRANPVARDMVANVKLQMAFVKARNVKISDIAANAIMKNLSLNIEGARLQVFNGTAKAGMQMQMAPKTPTYQFNLSVDKLDLQNAVESQFAMFKNTLMGIASFRMQGGGASFNPTPAKKNLSASGHFEALNATFATIDVGRSVVEALNKSIDGISQKVPALKGKTLGAPGNIDSRYSIVSSDFTISGGRFCAPNFVAKAEPNKGLDLKGDTKVGLVDLGLDANWEVVDTYNLTKARDLNVAFEGINVDHILADNDGLVHIPIKVGGTCAAPQVSYTAVPEALGKVALNNSTKALTGKAKAEARKKVEEAIQKQAPPQVQEALKKFGGKLFGN